MMQHYYTDIEGWFSLADADFYAWLVSQVPHKGIIVELGCWKGRSLSCLLVEVANSGKEIDVYGVDWFAGSIQQPDLLRAAATQDLCSICEANAKRSGYKNWWIYKMSSGEAAGRFPEESVDAVFFDGSHDEPSVSADLAAWVGKIKPSGIACGHDCFELGVAMAVTKAFGKCEPKLGHCWAHKKGT